MLGGRVGDATVIRISEDSVTLKSSTGKETLELIPGVKKTPATKPADEAGSKEPAKKKTVQKTVKKGAAKPADISTAQSPPPAEIELNEEELLLAEKDIFGSFGSPSSPVVAAPKRGIIKRSSVARKDETAGVPVLGKRVLDEKKITIIRKETLAKAKEEEEKHEAELAAAPQPQEVKEEKMSAAYKVGGREKPDDKAEAVRRHIFELKEQEKKKKEREEKQKKHEEKKEERFEVKQQAPFEKAIVVIREDEPGTGPKAVSYKEFDASAVVDDADKYEEVEQVVEEVIEEVEYEEEAVRTPITAPKKKSEDEYRSEFGGQKRRRRKKKKKQQVDILATKDAVKRTLAQINVESTASRKRYKKAGESGEGEVEETNVVKVSEFMSVAEIAGVLNVKPADIIAACMKLGLMVAINHRLDFDTVAAVVDEFGFKAELMEEYAEDTIVQEKDDPADLVKRPPVVTVMGHVDHGKTSLLDFIRKTNVVGGESGGITQHIGAYRVLTRHGYVTFLDTPGHEAFATMRARGARVTDLVVLVVAADSNVMPQTIESIDHAKAAGVKIIVAINKMDLPTANPQQIKNQLAQHGVIVEDFGGATVAVEISCKTGQNIEKLLDMLALESDLLELKANPKRKALGTIIESRLDSQLGVVVSLLVNNGTLHRGDNFVTGSQYGRVKVMTDEHGVRIDESGPCTPVQVLGLNGVPRAGDNFTVVESEQDAREIALKRSQAEKERERRRIKHMSLDELYDEIKIGGVRDVNLIIKGDVDGSVEALSGALQNLSTDKIKISIVHKSVGAIKESDIQLAAATNAVIIGFHVYPNSKVRELAQSEGVDLRVYRIIYEAVEEMEKALKGMLEPTIREVVTGEAEVRDLFKISNVGVIAGTSVTTGVVKRNSMARILRDSKVVFETKIVSLKRLKDDASEVKAGFECGIGLDGFNDLKVGDFIQTFESQRIPQQE